MVEKKVNLLMRQLPAMEKILKDERSRPFLELLDRDGLKIICTEVLNDFRSSILGGDIDSFDEAVIYQSIGKRVSALTSPSLRTVVNATGVVVHTNLGRSCLAPEAVESVLAVASHYNTLEYDIEAGARGQRNSHVESLLCRLTGAEAAVVVNNNASAVLLCLAVFSAGRSAIVSRGELVEIGGSFRIPDIMTFSGTRLSEVGTTNRTHLRDYENALDEDTAMIMKVHPSNFRVVGFHKEVSREELSTLSRKSGVIFMEDLGSGVLIGTENFGLGGEPSVAQCLQAGVDLVTFSGDKLLGGPQIGAIVGSHELIDKLRTYPLLRALRCDKMTLAAMEATLRLYLSGDWKHIPTLSMLSCPLEQLRAKADNLAGKLAKICPEGTVSVVEEEDVVGGGAFPATGLKGYAVRVCVDQESAGTQKEKLRKGPVPVIAGARDDALILHVRTLLDGDEDLIVQAFSDMLEV